MGELGHFPSAVRLARPGYPKRDRGDVEDGQIAEASAEEPVDQPGRPAADVDDRVVGAGPRGADGLERRTRLGLEPAAASVTLA